MGRFKELLNENSKRKNEEQEEEKGKDSKVKRN